MKRRRRGLGSSAAVHTRRGDDATHSARGDADDAIRLAEDGKCSSAYQYLKIAVMSYGKVIAEHEGGGKKPSSDLTQAVHRATDHFGRYCIRR